MARKKPTKIEELFFAFMAGITVAIFGCAVVAVGSGTPLAALLPDWNDSKEVVAAMIGGGMTIVAGAFVFVTSNQQIEEQKKAGRNRDHQEMMIILYYSHTLIQAVLICNREFKKLDGNKSTDHFLQLLHVERILKITQKLSAQVRSGRVTFPPKINRISIRIEIDAEVLHFIIETNRKQFAGKDLAALKSIAEQSLDIFKTAFIAGGHIAKELSEMHAVEFDVNGKLGVWDRHYAAAKTQFIEDGLIDMDPPSDATAHT